MQIGRVDITTPVLIVLIAIIIAESIVLIHGDRVYTNLLQRYNAVSAQLDGKSLALNECTGANDVYMRDSLK